MDKFTEIERGANIGAMGLNNLQEPSPAQAIAGNYKMGRINFHGLSIAIENPRGTFRTGVNKSTGKAWSNRMAAHYGYLVGTRGNDGDGIDVFVGHTPESERVFVINQIDPSTGAFDEHKILLGFYGLNDAKTAYNSSYDRGWAGIGSIVEASLTQIKWWIKHGNKKAPISASALPQEGYSNMQQTQWKNGEDGGTPIGTSLDDVLYGIRRNDPDNLIFDSVSMDQVMSDADESITLDALVIPFAQVERKMGQLKEILGRTGTELKVTSLQISSPFKQRGVANVAAIYELSDGQTVTAYFHNPDTNPSKLAATDEMISWKWLLNKKDITIIAAPERGEDLNPREVARRLMKLAEKNSAAFKRVNVKRSERMASIESLKGEVSAKESELTTLQDELATKRAAKEKRASEKAVEPTDNEPNSPPPVQAEVNNYGKNVVSVYSTATGKEAMKISRNEGSNGVTYSYIGSYGAGSGHSFEHMLKEVNDQKRFRRGMHVTYGVEFADIGKVVSEPTSNTSLPIENAAETSEPAPSEDDADTAAPVTFDLSEAVGDFDKAKVIRDLADDQAKRFSGALQAFKDQHPSLQFGITPDDVKAMPEYQLLSKNSDFAFNELRRVNEWIVKNFKNENSEDVRKGREVRLANAPLFESLKKAGVLYIQRGKSLYLGKLNKATGDTTIQQYTNNKQADSAVAKLLNQGFAAHVSARHPFVVVIDGASEPKSVDLPAYQEVAGAEEVPIQISGDELGDFPDGYDGFGAMSQAAEDYYRENLQNKTVFNASIPADIEIRKSTNGKMTGTKNPRNKLKLIPAMLRLLSDAKVEARNPPKDIESELNIREYLTLTSPLLLEGKRLIARLIVKLDDKGHYIYDQSIKRGAVQGSLGVSKEADASKSYDPNLNHSSGEILEPNLANVKLDSVDDGMVLNIFIEGEDNFDIEFDSDEVTVELKSTEDAQAVSVDESAQVDEQSTVPELESSAPVIEESTLEQTSGIATEQKNALVGKFSDEEQSFYGAFDPSSVKMPTAKQLGLVAGGKSLRLIEDDNHAEVTGWSNGHVLDIASIPSVILEAQKEIEDHGGSPVWVSVKAINTIVNQAKIGDIPLTPIAKFDVKAKPEHKKAKGVALAALMGNYTQDHSNLVLGNTEKSIGVHVNKFYYAYFAKVYKGAEFFTDELAKNVLVKHHGVVVGVLMPVRLRKSTNDKDTKNHNTEAFERAQQASQSTSIESESSVAASPEVSDKGSPLDAFENGGGEAWQVTRAKWVEIMRGHMASLGQSGQDSEFEDYHKSQVKAALDNGKPVHAEVLTDYPDLKAETQEEKDARYEKTEQALKNIVSVASGGVIANPLEQDAAKDPDTNEPASVDDPKDESKVNSTTPDGKIDDPLESDAAVAPQPSVAEGFKEAVVDDPLEVVEAAKIPVDRDRKLAAPPILDYRLKESGGQTYLVPLVGKGFSKKDREDLVGWLRDAGYFVGVISDHKIAVSETSNSPSLNQIDDGQEIQKTIRWLKSPEAQKLKEELNKSNSITTPSLVDDELLLQSVIDGKADIWDASLAGKLEAILGRAAGNEPLQAKWAKAINAYSTAALAVAQKTMNG